MVGVSSPFPHGQVVASLITTDLVRRLVAGQFPRYAHLPVRPVAHDGWDNRTLRLGAELTVRLPSAEGYVGQIAKEHRWLPELAPRLPLPIPVPVGLGHPGEGFPFSWSIYRWIDGDVASTVPIPDRVGFGADVAAFLTALQAADASDGPGFGLASAWRGGPLTTYAGEAVTACESCATRSISTPRWRCGTRPPRRGGSVRRCGSTVTSPWATCCCGPAGWPR